MHDYHDIKHRNKLIVDCFAGGGGASLGIEWATGRSPDIAINHSPQALAMHRANHPDTIHYCEDVWDVDPLAAVQGRPVGIAWFSPDCCHFSRAKGGKPVRRKIRGLAWIVVKWAKLPERLRPDLIFLENVREFAEWGPLDENDKPCPMRKGFTYRRWKKMLENLGYRVESRELRGCDYGAPTIRKRLFIVCSRVGPITWPRPTHGASNPYPTAADCIDWTIPCPSIFDRKKPLAENTLKRVARGVDRFVLRNAKPFIIKFYGTATGSPVNQPLHTVTGQGFKHGLVAPSLITVGYGEREGQAPRVRDIQEPMATVVSGGIKQRLVAAFLAKHFGGMTGVPIDTPTPTITAKGCQNQIVEAELSPAQDERAAKVYAFLQKYNGTAVGQRLDEPMHTVIGNDRFALVTVEGTIYRVVDIGMRMLRPRELFRAQGFPDEYIIDPEYNGKPLTKTAQVAACGNSVNPQIAAAIIAANIHAEHWRNAI